jgi:hypothetical protein
VDDGVEVVGELGAGLGQAGWVGRIADDGVDVEPFGRDLQIVAAGAADHHVVPGVAETSAMVRPTSVSPPVTSTSTKRPPRVQRRTALTAPIAGNVTRR